MKHKVWKLLVKINFPICQGFAGPCLKIGRRRRQNTAYVNDESNYVFMCGSCFKDCEEHWAEMWSDYYLGRL